MATRHNVYWSPCIVPYGVNSTQDKRGDFTEIIPDFTKGKYCKLLSFSDQLVMWSIAFDRLR